MKVLVIPVNQSFVFIHRGYQLAKHLAELGDEVHFIIWDPYPYPIDIGKMAKNVRSSLKYVLQLKDGVVVHKIPRLSFFLPLINGYMFKRFVSRLSKREYLDAIISASFSNETVPPFDLPLIYDIWDDNEAYLNVYAHGIERFAKTYILNQTKSVRNQINHAVAVTAVSNILVDYAKKIAPDTPVYKITNGVDALFLDTPLDMAGNRFGKHSMVYVSNFDEWANLPKLLEATGLVQRLYPDTRLVLVGEGSSIPTAKKIAASLGLSEHVDFLGRVERKEVAYIVSGCEIALSTCKKDPWRESAFPLKIMEYTALGKRIVSSNLEEVKLLNFPNIVLYDESKGVEELADGVIKAFNMGIDQREIRKLAYKYTWSGVAQQFHNIILDAVSKRK